MFEEILSNVTVLAFLAVTLSKVIENTIGKLYENIPVLKNYRWTIIFWSILAGILLCLRAEIGILPALPLPTITCLQVSWSAVALASSGTSC